MKKGKTTIILVSLAIILFLCIMFIVNINTDKPFNYNNERTTVQIDLSAHSEDYEININDNIYVLEKADGSYLSGKCEIYKANNEESVAINDESAYYIVCYYNEHSTSKGTEYYFEKPNGFYALVSSDGRLLVDLTENISEMFF